MGDLWINGTFTDESSASVSVRDAGLLHGAGVFTTMRAVGGRVFRIREHLARLRQSCEALFVPLTQTDRVLQEAAQELLDRRGLRAARLRLTVTRGATSTDPVHGLRVEPTTILTATDFEPYPDEFYKKGMTVMLLDTQKLNPYDLQAGHKTLDYFSRLGALREANRRGTGEALWFNVHNYLQSGCVSNVVLIKDGVIQTPPTQQEIDQRQAPAKLPYPRSNVLPGIIRWAVLEAAKEWGTDVSLAGLTVQDVLGADEIFLTNSIMGVMPVCRIERHAVGTDKPGPLTTRLYDHLNAQMDAAGG